MNVLMKQDGSLEIFTWCTDESRVPLSTLLVEETLDGNVLGNVFFLKTSIFELQLLMGTCEEFSGVNPSIAYK